MKNRYISIAGTMGVGKTTLVNIIAKELSFRPIFENFAANPFLPKFYQDMKRWAFHSQTFFLLEKVKQLEKISSRLRRGFGEVIQDTPIYEDVFSYAKAQKILGNMSNNEWKLYFDFYELSESYLVKPDLVIFLSASVKTIYQRIVQRTRDYEVKKKKEDFLKYLKVLDRLNREWIKDFKKKIKIVKIDTEDFDYLRNKRDKVKLLLLLEKHIR